MRAKVQKGSISSLFGTFPIDAPDGEDIAIAIRPRNISLQPIPSSHQMEPGCGRVVDIRFADARHILHLTCVGHHHTLYHIHVELDANHPLPSRGSLVKISATQNDLLTFPWRADLDMSFKG